MKHNFLQGKAIIKCVRWYSQHGWIDPDTNNTLWNDRSFAHPRVDKYSGGIVVGHDAYSRRAGARRRVPGVLGLRRHPTIGRGDVEARILHHPRARLHAGDRSPEFAARRPLTIMVDYMTNHVQVT